jgi:hypothetical protein
MTNNKLVFKVAAIVDEKNVVINKGKLDGIDVGQAFMIYTIGDEIFDPDTKQSLGKLEIIRGTGKVARVQDHMATIQTSNTKATRPSTSILGQYLGTQVELIPFKDPQVGDLVKRID